MDALEMGYAAAILKEGDVEINVPIPKSYRAAINDPIYGPKWRTAIEEELKALGINGTWREEIPPKGSQPSFDQMGIHCQGQSRRDT